MKTRTKRLLRNAPVLTLALLLVLASPMRSNAAPPSPGKGATVFIVRGGGGYFPNLGKIVFEHYQSRGLHVVDYRVHQRGRAAREITDAHRSGKLPHGVILVGYSLGGSASIRLSEMLAEAQVPVRLLVLIENVSPDLLVPANVQACFNLYHAPASTVGPVRAASARTKVVNCEAHGDAGFGREYSHFAIPWVDGVHELVAGEIVNVVNRRPLGRIAPQRLHLKTAQANAAPSRKIPSTATLRPQNKKKSAPPARTKTRAKTKEKIAPSTSAPWPRKAPRGATQYLNEMSMKMRGW